MPADYKSSCKTASDCKVFTVCCGAYKACNEKDMNKCLKTETEFCAMADCALACPNPPTLEEYQRTVQCINNKCQIDQATDTKSWSCYAK